MFETGAGWRQYWVELSFAVSHNRTTAGTVCPTVRQGELRRPDHVGRNGVWNRRRFNRMTAKNMKVRSKERSDADSGLQPARTRKVGPTQQQRMSRYVLGTVPNCVLSRGAWGQGIHSTSPFLFVPRNHTTRHPHTAHTLLSHFPPHFAREGDDGDVWGRGAFLGKGASTFYPPASNTGA